MPDDPAVDRTEARRAGSGRVVAATLAASRVQLDIPGNPSTYAYADAPPVIRLGAGDTLRATLTNRLPVETSVHWHGLALRNDMDGVPPLTQDPIAPGAKFVYDFIAPDPGTHWFHPHVGAQLDTGLYGALIVEDPKEPLTYDDEWVIVLDDWLDGVTATPDDVLAELSEGMGDMGDMGDMEGMDDDMYMRMGNTLMGASSDLLGGDAGDVYYPHYLINGKNPEDPSTFDASPGQRIRLRIINAGGDTAFRVAIGGHTLAVTHSDGYPVQQVEVDSILVGMGERYDALVTLDDGVFPLVALAEGKRAQAFAVVRTGRGAPPPADTTLSEFTTGRVATADQLKAVEQVALPTRAVDREITLDLTGGMAAYDWGVNDKRFDMTDPLRDAYAIQAGERVRLRIVNQTEMWHPFHLHGHTYQHPEGGPRKDTSIVLPDQTLTVEFDADNPGQWLAHCHNIYHGETGMMAVIGYEQ